MTSVPAPIDVPSSPRSSVSSVLQSFAHSQSLVASSHIASSQSLSSFAALEDDEEATLGFTRPENAVELEDDAQDDYDDNLPTPVMEYRGTPFVADLPWDGENDDRIQTPTATNFPSGSTTPRALSLARSTSVVREKRPLLESKLRSYDATEHVTPPRPQAHNLRRYSSTPKFLVDTAHDALAVGGVVARKSTFSQSLFNSMAILLGVGLLSEPLAFSYAGWIGGTILITFYGWLTCYTAKILAKLIRQDASLRTYTDIARKAFGPRATGFTSALFCLELFTLSVVLVTLFADSLHEVAPAYSADTYKLLAFVILLPTTFLPLSLLSYASLVGVASTLFIIFVVVFDGLSKMQAPGSLWEPAETTWGAASPLKLTLAFGLFMAGFSGHAVIPSLALDMEQPEDFDRVMDIAFTATTFLYALIGAAGYLMFGSNISPEISQDLLHMPGYNASLNELCVWMLVVVPLTKYALASRPLNITVELLLGLNSPAPVPVHDHEHASHHTGWGAAVVIERTALVALTAAVAVLIPDFSASMAFLGSFSAFVLCVLLPICAKIAVERRCSALDAVLLAVSCAMAASGTAAAFFAAAE